MVTERLEWTIYYKGRWIAIHNDSQNVLVAYDKSSLMSQINQFEKIAS